MISGEFCNIFQIQEQRFLRKAVADKRRQQGQRHFPDSVFPFKLIALSGPVDPADGEFFFHSAVADVENRARIDFGVTAQVPYTESETVFFSPPDAVRRDPVTARDHPVIRGVFAGFSGGVSVEQKLVRVINAVFHFKYEGFAFPTVFHQQGGFILDSTDAGP